MSEVIVIVCGAIMQLAAFWMVYRHGWASGFDAAVRAAKGKP